jgi:hypothetical protein
MAAIKLTTGEVYDVSGVTRQTALDVLARDGAATGLVNGVQTTFRSAAVIAVSDSLEGLRAREGAIAANAAVLTDPDLIL